MTFSKKCFIIFVLISTRCLMLDSRPHEDGFSKGISTFAQDFYQQCSESIGEDNMIISPFSTLIALALLCQATEGNSFEELRKLMHLSGTKAAIVDEFHKYYGLVQKSAGQSEFLIGNQIFVMEGYQLKTDFQEIAVNKFCSGVESVNFSNSVKTAQTINQFVKEKTKEKIKELVKPDTFNPLDRVFLVNAIYLKSRWLHPFLKNTNRRGSGKLKLDFFINDTSSVRVEFMTVKEKFWYATLDDLDATAVRLDYVNSSLSFVIVLPRHTKGLGALESQLNNYDMSQITGQMKFLKGDVTIPKFKIQSDFNLNKILEKMGVVSVFVSQFANLSGLLNSTEQLYVAEVLHKVVIEINEEYTEAAVATGFRATSTSRKLGEETFTFLAKHPFMFYIWDRGSQTTIFSGRITNFSTNSTLV